MKRIAKSIIYRLIAGVGIIIFGILAYVRNVIRRGEDISFGESDSFFLWYLIAFLLCVLLGSAFIDYVRIETKWHTGIKIVISIFIFLIAFISFLFSIAILEAIRFS